MWSGKTNTAMVANFQMAKTRVLFSLHHVCDAMTTQQ